MKRGAVTTSLIQWLTRIIFLVIVVFSVLFLIRMNITKEVHVIDSEMNIFIFRLMYSEGGVSLQEDGRVYPGRIVLEDFKLLNETLLQSMDFGEKNNHVSIRFALYEMGPKDQPIHETTFNKGRWKLWKILSNLGWNGPGGITSSNKDGRERMYIIEYLDEGKWRNGILKMEVLMPNG